MTIQDPILQMASVIFLLLIFAVAHFLIRKKLIYSAVSFLIGMTTYFLILVLSKNEFGLAAGLGLFAIFGIIRYRTEQVPILEMTHIFLCITIAVISALADGIVNTFFSIILINLCLMIITILVFIFANKREEEKIEIVVDSVDWLKLPLDEQLNFLKEKSFKHPIGFELIKIDWLKETSIVNVIYRNQ